MYNAFASLAINHGQVYDDIDPLFGTRITPVSGGRVRTKNAGETHFIYCHQGEMYIEGHHEREFLLSAGMYACIPGPALVDARPQSYGVLISKPQYNGLFMIGGPVEENGRLKYIDGCTDSLLIPPVMLGDPCFNLLCFPPGIDQTMHTHPSVRLGMVITGRGLCRYLNEEGTEEHIDLYPGQTFVIATGGAHAFSTPYTTGMRVVAYHPDSDHGPTHEEHPMLNRTIINGVSAKDPRRAQYRTK